MSVRIEKPPVLKTLLLSFSMALAVGCGGSSPPPVDADAGADAGADPDAAVAQLAIPSAAGLANGAATVSSSRYRGHVVIGGPAPAGLVSSPNHAGGVGLGLQEVIR